MARHPIPIVFLTASTKPDNVDAIHRMTNAWYLAKPITSDSLTDVLQRVLRIDAQA